MVPIVAYNYGAKNKKRITHTIRLSIVSAICIMLLGLALFMIFPAQLLGLFNASGSMLQIGVPALRIICLSFTFAGFCIVVGFSLLLQFFLLHSVYNFVDVAVLR